MPDLDPAAILYGTPEPQQQPAPGAASQPARDPAAALYGEPAQEQRAGSGDDPAVSAEEHLEDVLQGGDPPETYAPRIRSFTDQDEQAARMEGNQEWLQHIGEVERGLEEGLREFQIGDTDAQQAFALASEYRSWPKSDTAAAHERQQTLEAIRGRYGDRTDAMLAGAQKVVAAFDKRAPGFARFLSDSGMGNNATFVTRMISIARKRGLT